MMSSLLYLPLSVVLSIAGICGLYIYVRLMQSCAQLTTVQQYVQSPLQDPTMDHWISALVDDVKNLDQAVRTLSTLMQPIHQNMSPEENSTICEKCRQVFTTVCGTYRSISQKVPDGEYYKYVSQWQNASNRLCFLASLLIYVESGKLATRNEVMEMLGVEVDRKRGFHIDLEEYLCGLLSLASELSRLAVNSVICGDYDRPMAISKFVGELESGFRLLNLKNDFLRKKYDGLKYDVKRIEQVVYDVKVRGLVTGQEQSDSGAA